MKNTFLKYIFSIFLLSGNLLFAQIEPKSPVQYIQNLVQQDSLTKAKKLVSEYITTYKAEKNYDSLVKYIQFEGSFILNNGNKQKAIKKAEILTFEIKNTEDPHLVTEAYTELGWIYDDASLHQKAYELLTEALPYAKRNTEPKNTDYASVYYRLGYYASKLGNYTLSKKNYIKALQLLQKSGKEDYVFYNQVYNALGGIMWQETKLDSAKYYFEEAVKVLEKTDEKDIMNRYYRPALVKMNLAVLWNSLGKNQEAIAISQESYAQFQEYLNRSTDEARIKKVKTHQCVVLDNMATFYNTLGEHSRAQQLIEYSFEQKKKLFEPNDINIIISLIILSEAKIASRDFEGAAIAANKAIKLLETSPGANFYWDAAAISTRANIYELMGDMKNAEIFYEKSIPIYRKSLGGGSYSKDFLDNLISLSLFYAKIKKSEKAIEIAQETYNETQQGDFKNTIQQYYHIINLAQVNYIIKNYNEAEKYSQEALSFNNLGNSAKLSASDSILSQYRKPQALYINAASKYYLNENKNVPFLKELLENIDKGIAILDQRKKVVNSPEDLKLLITENEELFNFAKKLRLELYEKTKDVSYLDKVIALHESSIYTRIRSRLNLREKVAFKNVPKEVIERENKLKTMMASSLNDTEKGIKSYFKASENWDSFLESLNQKYPEYYKMRYATLEESINDLQQKIPPNTTVIRYLFIEDQLYAFVVSTKEKNMFPLKYETVKNHISELAVSEYSMDKSSQLLLDLYDVLWKPIEKNVKSQKIIIIPDRELFNLSFETLTPKKLKSFNDFATNSLLAKYDISYNFSLLLYKDKRKVVDYADEYIAFAPGFTEQMKENYKLGIKDSVALDKNYLTLLPQPFSEDLAQQYAKIFNGDYFINENASKKIFVNKANEHKIIHIGTHAESNNISPELSRLIFAKNMDGSENYDENSLYTYEIYNINLSSNLAILTACETGKPTYQPGEGMISLAHAFNYAGSESILTSLWKIDESSSTKIIELFYNNLKAGMAKDEALRKAKLDYITTAEGRTISPQYWAGLVLIGDTSPLDFNSGISIWWWILGGIVLLIIAVFYYRKNKKS